MNMDVDMDVQNSQAYKAVQQALALSSSASEEEQLYIHALAQRSSSDDHADGQKLDAGYAEAMTDLARRYPDDLDAVAMSMEARMMAHRYEWFHHDMAQEGTAEIIRDLEGLLRRDPDHPLANHLYIHILDTGHPEMALGVAYRIPQIAPGLGHLVHMSGHIFYNLGDYEMTARVNEQAAAAEREYANLVHPDKNIYTLLYYMHDIHFISRARAEQGLFTDAKRAADQIADLLAPLSDEWSMISDYYAPVPLFTLLRFHRWDDVLQLPEPSATNLVTHAFWYYGRGMAFAAKGQRQQALKEKAKLEAARHSLRFGFMWMFNSGEAMLNLASLVLDARLAEDTSLSIAAWHKAVKAQDDLAYDEPPPWYYPVRESLGAALLRSGNSTEAESVFRECVRQNPRDPRALFGLMAALRLQGKTQAADLVRTEFDSAWRDSSRQLRLEDF